MIAYSINTILCSALLLLLYKLFLEKERMHVFKRSYLIASVIISLTAPLITISFPGHQQTFVLEYLPAEPGSLITSQPAITVSKTTDNLSVLLVTGYVIGLLFGFFRLMNILSKIYKQTGKAKLIPCQKARLALTEKNILPYSFLNTIFVSKEAYLNGKIEKEVLAHELAHVKQYHSLDILFIQLIHCIFWFNPLYIFYRRAIQLNHEFLADEAVLSSYPDPVPYQYLLLQKASEKKSFALASQFNYSVIKKRLVMITKNTSRKALIVKKMASGVLFLLSIALFSTKELIAQKIGSSMDKTEVPSTIQGASPQEIDEYEAIIAKHENALEKGRLNIEVSKEEREKLFNIYAKMSKEQQNKQKAGFVPKPPAKVSKKLTQEQLQLWADSKKYFVRINGWKIDNSILENKTAADLIIYEYYEPNKGSTDYGKYEAQINLMTTESYAQYVKYWNEREPYFLVTFSKRVKK